jgi:fructosamine-3-kinase
VNPLPGELGRQVCQALGAQQPLRLVGAVSGGDISNAYRAVCDRFELFIKINTVDTAALFEAEFHNLQALADRQPIRVPEPVCHGSDAEQSWLVLEYIALQRDGDHEALGHGLATMHRALGTEYGWPTDNFIGLTPQVNGSLPDWTGFWWHRRLWPLVERLVVNGDPHGLQGRAEAIRERLPSFFDGRVPRASLLHGDLWGGNAAFDEQGRPVIYDPACYHGDRETDIAMTELFGGFDARFHAAYREAWPLAVGYQWRRSLYQAYHLLNHMLMFGDGWLPRVNACLDGLVRDDS